MPRSLVINPDYTQYKKTPTLASPEAGVRIRASPVSTELRNRGPAFSTYAKYLPSGEITAHSMKLCAELAVSCLSFRLSLSA